MTWPRSVVREAVSRAGLDPDAIEEVILGNANGAGEENRNVARMATLLAGLPLHIPGITVNRLCASGLSAIIMASHMIKSGAADIVIAGGVESMSRAPWVQEKPQTAFAKPGAIFDTSIGWRFANPLFQKGELSRDGKMTYSMPETAEEVGRVDGISREDADAFAVRSHERSLAAIAAGRFKDEIVPVTVKTRKGETVVDTDEGPRAGTTMDVLAGLRPVVTGRLGGHRRQLLHPERRRLRHHRGVRGRHRTAGPDSPRPHHRRRLGRLRARDHGHRPRPRHPEGARAERLQRR